MLDCSVPVAREHGILQSYRLNLYSWQDCMLFYLRPTAIQRFYKYPHRLAHFVIVFLLRNLGLQVESIDERFVIDPARRRVE